MEESVRKVIFKYYLRARRRFNRLKKLQGRTNNPGKLAAVLFSAGNMVEIYSKELKIH